MVASKTLGSQLLKANFRPSGFDYLRICLAFVVLLVHGIVLPQGAAFREWALTSHMYGVATFFLVPAFFTLSGFLVANSLERAPSLFVFLGYRVIRILPALAVEILVSAIILGAFFTTLSLREYYSDPQFRAYFGNIVGNMHYELPGVFADNPAGNFVNAQLWTVPWELKCYIALALIAILGVARRSNVLLVFSAAALLASVGYEHFFHPPTEIHNDLGGGGHLFVLCFLWGVVLFQFKDVVPHGIMWIIASLIVYYLFSFVPHGSTLATIPIAYATVAIGTCNFRKARILETGDYSYGVYLYHFTVQQAIIGLGLWTRHWYIVVPASIVLVSFLSAASWFFVEKPAGSLRKYLHPVDERLKAALGALGQQLSKKPG
jgi:peptidoglycan/LPS O-acetylase OafA/YrhL